MIHDTVLSNCGVVTVTVGVIRAWSLPASPSLRTLMLPVGRSVGGPGARGGAHFGKAATRPYFPQFEAELGEMIRVGEQPPSDSPAAWLVHVTPDTGQLTNATQSRSGGS
jgi:hypothetical protein